MDTDPPRARSDALRLHLLVMRCQAGDERAFAALVERFGASTLRYVAGLVGGDDAEDVQQEVWLGVYRRIGQLASPAAFVTWLFTLARHRAVDHLRRRRRERELRDDVAAAHVALGAAAPEHDGHVDLDDAGLRRALAALPALHREVLLLRFEDDLSYADIAVVTGCSIGTVKSRLHHARRRLQGAIAHETHSSRGHAS